MNSATAPGRVPDGTFTQFLRGKVDKTMNMNIAGLAQWDLVSFFENAGDYVKLAGGAFLALIGIAAVVWAGFMIVKKLWSSQPNNDSWFKIIALLILGGGLMVGGSALMITLASGGQQTILDFGGGMALLGL